jgi:electron transfer flavoprotein beta subunit
MNILVCISKTPDTTAKIAFTDNDTKFDENGVSFIMNPYDEWYALVRALELKESLGGKVVAISVGDAASDIVIRKALAIGADEAVRIDANPQSSFHVADQVATYAKDKGFDAIFTGKETIDFNGSEVGSMIAEFLDLPFFSHVSKLEQNGDEVTVEREIEGGVEKVSAHGAYVISAAKGIAQQRIPNMRGIMMAKRKPLQVVEASDSQELVKLVSFEKPAEKHGVKMVDPNDMDELVRLLHEEAKVI